MLNHQYNTRSKINTPRFGTIIINNNNHEKAKFGTIIIKKNSKCTKKETAINYQNMKKKQKHLKIGKILIKIKKLLNLILVIEIQKNINLLKH